MLEDNISRLYSLARESTNQRQLNQIDDKIYLKAKKILRVYYFGKGDKVTSVGVLNWSRDKVLRKAYSLGLI